ncbi:MAG: hypothetical protein AMJ54_00415 [Deltaproteobacteria bacterium SG8_13]|nr:MAG: hypothetical protein AMJ54_00415 [Deltaproteobacteria bacterium SG8_13]
MQFRINGSIGHQNSHYFTAYRKAEPLPGGSHQAMRLPDFPCVAAQPFFRAEKATVCEKDSLIPCGKVDIKAATAVRR